MKKWFLVIFLAGWSLAFVPASFAQCTVGELIPGGCGNYTFEGCCEDNNTVRWCENGMLCQIQCDITANQLPTNSCCEPSFTNSEGCCDLDIWQCVCASDSYCCNFPWDQACANKVVSLGCGTCPSFCPNPPFYCGWDQGVSAFNCVDVPGQVAPTGAYSCAGGSCTPNCLNKQCGNDGCGSVCGTCPAGQVCSAQFQCVASGSGGAGCVPSCVGKQCGDDGCGELSCGSCGLGKLCSPEFTCIDCVPQCNGRLCGDDGCSGQCGFCGTGEDCSELGFCIEAGCSPYCPGKQCGDDGCGGKCGVCSEGFSCSVEGQCISGDGRVQPEANPDASGTAPPVVTRNFPGGGTWTNPCQPGQIYQYGLCVEPAHSQEPASGRPGGDVTVSGCSANSGSSHGATAILLLGTLFVGLIRRQRRIVGVSAGDG